jgi:hypothetical protein
MIHYSSHPDLYKVIEMFAEMSQEDKALLEFNNQHFFTKLTMLHYKLIKGQCLMLVNEDGVTVGFASIDLENDSCLFITELYITPKYRPGSLSLLLEMFNYLKVYMRPIHFITSSENKKMRRLAEYVNGKPFTLKSGKLKYVIHI